MINSLIIHKNFWKLCLSLFHIFAADQDAVTGWGTSCEKYVKIRPTGVEMVFVHEGDCVAFSEYVPAKIASTELLESFKILRFGQLHIGDDWKNLNTV